VKRNQVDRMFGMGFKFITLDSNTCIFKATPEGDDNQDILLCIQSALKTLHLNIIIDVTEKPLALESVIAEIRSLQRVMTNHSKSLKIKGVHDSLTPESLAMLGELKVELEPVISSQSSSAQQIAVPLLAAERFKGLRVRLSKKIQGKRALETEKVFYIERLKVLRGNRAKNEDADVTIEKLQKIGALEQENFKLIDEKHSLEKKLEDITLKLKQVDEQVQNDSKTLREENKKKSEPFEKKIAELQKKLTQTAKDYEKRSEARKAKI
jgi:hypothetical protein